MRRTGHLKKVCSLQCKAREILLSTPSKFKRECEFSRKWVTERSRDSQDTVRSTARGAHSDLCQNTPVQTRGLPFQSLASELQKSITQSGILTTWKEQGMRWDHQPKLTFIGNLRDLNLCLQWWKGVLIWVTSPRDPRWDQGPLALGTGQTHCKRQSPPLRA